MRRPPARRPPSRSLALLKGLAFLSLGVGGALYFRVTPPESIGSPILDYASTLPADYPALDGLWKLIPALSNAQEGAAAADDEVDLLAGFGETSVTDAPEFTPDELVIAQSEPPIEEGTNVRQAAYVTQPVTEPAEQSVEQPVFNEPEPAAPPFEPAAPLVGHDFTEVDALMDSGDFINAHRQLSSLYWNKPELRETIRERIETTARSIFFSPQPHYMEPYVVQPGDQLQNVATRYAVPWEYLVRLNRIDPRRIRAEQKLKVIKGPFSALVDLSDFEITIHAHGYFVKSYRVGIGKEGTTPVGTFSVQTKLVNPTYYGPDGVVVDADDPSNPLGERWIDIGDSYGIHGTIDPQSIGRPESRGCVRMLNEEVAEVYDLLGVGSQVVIRR